MCGHAAHAGVILQLFHKTKEISAITKRVMIAAWGSRGDLQPVTALAVALKKRGLDVLVFATPPATDLLKENDINCVVAKEDIGQVVESMFWSS